MQAAIAEGEADAAKPDLHLLYERMESIDGFTAESRASRLLHGLGFAADEYRKAGQRILRRLAHAAESCPRADVPIRHPVAR